MTFTASLSMMPSLIWLPRAVNVHRPPPPFHFTGPFASASYPDLDSTARGDRTARHREQQLRKETFRRFTTPRRRF